MKKHAFFTVVLLSILSLQNTLFAQASEKESKIAFMVKDARMLNGAALSSIASLQGQGYASDEAAIVVIGPAVKELSKNGSLKETVRKALQSGVKLKACKIALDKMQVPEKELIKGVEVVDNGFFEMFRLQEKGFMQLNL
ncbi:DsrE family protein [Rapidithrix thailandica]|uniref:DsrE family protein n=1 Tax=Rapidithrix thailandica TaxID=413964 RepID=A0AAW9SDI5_9BACT